MIVGRCLPGLLFLVSLKMGSHSYYSTVYLGKLLILAPFVCDCEIFQTFVSGVVKLSKFLLFSLLVG
jgi:hypothetical protein